MKSKTDAIIIAMKDYLKFRKREHLRSLRGKISIEYDWRAEEAAEQAAQAGRDRCHDR